MLNSASGQMRAGVNGQVAISWDQTEIDGLEDAPLACLAVGAAWSWRGQAIVLSAEAESSVEQIGYARGAATRLQNRFPIVREISGYVTGALTLTNGSQRFSANLVADTNDAAPTIVFDGACPPRDEEFWIVDVTEVVMVHKAGVEGGGNVVAFPA